MIAVDLLTITWLVLVVLQEYLRVPQIQMVLALFCVTLNPVITLLYQV